MRNFLLFIVALFFSAETFSQTLAQNYNSGQVYYASNFQRNLDYVNAIFNKNYTTYNNQNPGHITGEFMSSPWPPGSGGAGSTHKGIDHRAQSPGHAIYSPLSGVVTATGGCTGKICIYNSTYQLTFIFLHCSSIAVGNGQTITKGQYVGVSGGVTCDPNGNTIIGAYHLHTELRSGSQTAAQTSAASANTNYDPRIILDFFPVVSLQPPTLLTPANNASNVSIPINFSWSSSVSHSNKQYRIQVSNTMSGWTAQNGFTDSTSPNSTVRVNNNTGNSQSFSWNSSSSFPPQVGTTYYWTVRVFNGVNATSDYSQPRSFTVASGAINYTISISSNPAAGGSTSGGGTYQNGQSCTVTASANSGYIFSNWTEGGTVVSSNSSYTFTVSANRTLVANFNPSGGTCVTCPSYDFSITPNSGWQTHSSSFATNGCKMYRIPVPSTPGYTYTFKTGCGDGASANFDTYLELYNSSCNFLVENDDACSTLQSELSWTSNYTSVGYIYLKVRGYQSASGNYTMAYRRVDPVVNYIISTSSNPAAGGSTSGGGSYQNGQSCTVTAHVSIGYTFSSWTEGGSVVSSNASYTFTVSSNRTLVANFSQLPVNFTITTSSNPSSGGSTSGGGAYQNGQSCTVAASANSGYTFSNWTEGGTVVSSNSNYTFTVSGNRALVANFTSSGGTCVTCPSFDFSITPNSGWQTHGSNFVTNGCKMYRIPVPSTPGYTYTFKTGCGDGASANFDTYLELYDGNCSLLAQNDNACGTLQSELSWTSNYTSVGYIYLKVRGYQSASGNYTMAYRRVDPVVTYIISTSSNPVAGGTTSGGGTYQNGQSCTVTASTNSGYTFSNWTEGGTVVSTNSIYTFTINSNRDLVANFTHSGQSIDLNNGLVAYYPFNGNANDESGNNNHGTVNGATLTTDRFCNANSAYNFAGISNPQTISVANSSSLQFADAATFSFWVNINSYQGMNGWGNNVSHGYHVLFAKDYDNCCLQAGIAGLANGQFSVHIGTGSGSNSVWDTVPNSALNQWVNIIFVITTTNISIYSDGDLIASQNGTMSFANSNTKNLWFGRLASFWYPFNGVMDDIRIYNRVLNTAEIQAIFNLGSELPTNGLIAHYPFNSNANDESGNGNHGTIHNQHAFNPGISGTGIHLTGACQYASYCTGSTGGHVLLPYIDFNAMDAFTISIWVNEEEMVHYHGEAYIFFGEQSANHISIIHSGEMQFGVGTTVITSDFEQSDLFSWVNWVMSFENGTLKAYKNGNLIGQETGVTYNITQQTQGIARHWWWGTTTSTRFTGMIDEVRIYNRALSNLEILQIYQSTNSTIGLPADAGMISGEAIVCQGQNSLAYTVPTIADATSYVWTLPSGATGASTTNSITVNYSTSATSGNITVKGTNSCGEGASSSKAITVNALPSQPGSITGPSTPCHNSTGNIYSVSNISGVTYNWTYSGTGHTITSGQNTSSIVVSYSSSATSGTWTVTPSNACGSGTPRTRSITIQALPAQPGSISGLTTPCQGSTGIVYSVSNVSGITYDWTYSGSGATITTGQGTNSITVNYSSSATSGTWTVTPSNACGSGTPRTRNITMQTLPGQPGSISGPTTAFQGSSGHTYSVTNVSGVTYTWGYSGNGAVINQGQGSNAISVSYSGNATSGSWTVTPGNNCGNGASRSRSVSIIPVPANIEVQNTVIFSDQSNCYNATQQIVVAGNGTHFIVFNNGNAELIAGQSIKFLPTTIVFSGGQLHAYISSTGNYCSLSKSLVTACSDDISRVVANNNDESIFHLFPNPTLSSFTLELTGDLSCDEITVEIYSMMGERLLNQELAGSRQYVFDLGNRPAGVYLVRIVKDGEMGIGKIVKQ